MNKIRLVLLLITLAAVAPTPSLAQDGPTHVVTLGTGLLYEVDWSPDGTHIGAATSTGIYLYDVATRELAQHLPVEWGAATALGFSPDGGMLAAASYVNTVQLFDTTTWDEVGRLDQNDDTDGHIWDLDWSPDGAYLAVVGHLDTWTPEYSRRGEAFIWDVERAEIISTLEGHDEIIMAVAWSPDGNQIATSGWDPEVRVWNVDGWAEAYRPPETDNWADVAWNGEQLLGAAWNARLLIWEQGETQQTAPIAEESLFAVAPSPDGERVLIGTRDGAVLVWDIATQLPAITMPNLQNRILSVEWSPDGAQFVVGGEQDVLRVFDGNTGELAFTIEAHLGALTTFSWAPVEEALVTGPFLRLWPRPEKSNALPYHVAPDVPHYSWSADGARVAFIGGDRTNYRAHIIEGGVLVSDPIPATYNRLSADGRIVLTDDRAMATAVYDAATGERLFHDADHLPRGLAPDGTEVVMIDQATLTEARLMDVSSGDLISTVSWENGFPLGEAQWNDDGRVWLVTRTPGEGPVVSVYDVRAAVEFWRWENDHGTTVITVLWSPDGARLATLSETGIAIRDVETGVRLALMEIEGFSAAAWSADGRWLATATGNTITIWEAATGAAIHRIDAPVNVDGLGWSATGLLAAHTIYDTIEVYAVE